MRVVRATVLPLICAAAAVSCADSGGVTDPVDQVTEVTPPIAPSTRGAEVFWTDLSVGFADFDDDLAGLVGLAGGAAAACANDLTTSNTRAHVVFTPSGGFFLGGAGGRDAPVELYEWEGAANPGNCDLAGSQLVGTGTASFTFSTGFTPHGAIVQTLILHGTLDLIGGGQARLEVRAHATVRPDGTVVLDHTDITLAPL